jgi:hypothetical protein
MVEARVWMIRKGLTVSRIAKELGYKNHTPVSLTLSGRIKNKRVLTWLRKAGCPEKALEI